jgi:flagellar M-ring protein FliF
MPEALRQLLAAIQQRFNSLQKNQQIAVMIGIATAIALVVGATLWTSSTPHKILFSNLSDKDGGAITQALQQMNIQYKTEAGGVISVPAEQVYDIRLRLASQGLPKGGTVGFELMDNQKLGISQFTEQVNYQRSVEGELAKSIESLASVESARVHLAVPRTTVFLREQQKPSASVVLTLHAGRVLDSAQVAGIVHLVSSSVPDLPVKNVTVVDQGGNLLSSSLDANNPGGLDPRQLNYLRNVEQGYVKRIEAILQPIAGKENIKAEVTASLDFSEIEQTSESFRPNSPPEKQAIRSQQSLETLNGEDKNAAGVPGAFSNQPPGNATAPITQPPGARPGVAGTNVATTPSSSHKEVTTNYEVDKTIQHTRQPVGTIKRLSAAVVVNYKPVVGKDGKTSFKAYTPQELTQINNLVKEAMGFNQTRGDSLNVVNAPFAGASEPATAIDRLVQEASANWQQIFKNVLITLVVLYLIFGVIRPAIRYMTAAPEPEKSGEGELTGEAQAELEAEEAAKAEEDEMAQYLATYADNLQAAKDLAKTDPRMVAGVVKAWIAKEDE